uniref:Cysteine proteinase inhibitor n=1 Tax=Salix viminalis TaxID=40686 RepID=A0A6N2MK90_SALVM
MATFGGIRQVEGAFNSAEIENLARFAVDEYHNKKQGSILELKSLAAQKNFVKYYGFASKSWPGGQEEFFLSSHPRFKSCKHVCHPREFSAGVQEGGVSSNLQVASRTIHYIFLEATDGGHNKVYYAEVYVEEAMVGF